MKLHLGPGLTLPAEAITETFGLLAARGAGKSNAAAVMAEEMFEAKLPFVVVDPVRAWWGLRSSADGKGAGLAIPIFGGRRGDVPLERSGGQLVADLVVDQRLSCVLDISDFDSEGARKQFLLDFARRLYQRNEHPLHLFLEEADDYIPQKPMRDEAQLLRAWENIVRRGRGRGLGCTLITQRSAVLNKNVLTQVQTLIPMRTTGPQDIAAIREWVKYHHQAEKLLESLPGLDDGEAWVWSPHFLKKTVRVKFRLRSTFDSGATPKASASPRPPATLADVDLGALKTKMAATIEKAKAEDPRLLRQRIQQLEGELRKQSVHGTQKVLQPREQRVEVPILKDAQIKRLEAAIHVSKGVSDRTLAALAKMAERAHEVLQALRAHREPIPLPRAPVFHPSSPSTSGTKVRRLIVQQGGALALPKGEAKVLTAIAQHDAGVTREQLTVLTGYRRSTRDTYVQRLRGRGLINDVGGQLFATQAGVASLPASFEPLPTGAELRAHWLRELPDGEQRLLEILVDAYPRSVEREQLSAKTGYARSSRDTYLQRLSARKLITTTRGDVRASEELF